MSIELSKVAARLEGLEETIIAKLLDRAQFHVNTCVYQPGESGFAHEKERCLFKVRLFHQETMDAQFGRFHVPEERPFNRELPPVQRQVTLPPSDLYINDYDIINLSENIIQDYMELIPKLCREGDDRQYGSSVEHDVYAFQAIARRIHYGAMYVAECKYVDDPTTYRTMIDNNDTDGMMKKLTRQEVEDKIIQRIREKVDTIQFRANPMVRHLVDPDVITSFYRDTIIPLTKKGEILYLLNRER